MERKTILFKEEGDCHTKVIKKITRSRNGSVWVVSLLVD